MSALLPPAAPGPDDSPPIPAAKLDTTDVLVLTRLVRAAGQPRPRLLLDYGAPAQGRPLGMALRNVSPGLYRSLHRRGLGSSFPLAE